MTIELGASVQFTDSAAAGQRPLFTGTPAQILESMPRYQEVGVQDFRVDFPSPSIDGLRQAMAHFATEMQAAAGEGVTASVSGAGPGTATVPGRPP